MIEPFLSKSSKKNRFLAQPNFAGILGTLGQFLSKIKIIHIFLPEISFAKILQSDWPGVFLAVTLENEF